MMYQRIMDSRLKMSTAAALLMEQNRARSISCEVNEESKERDTHNKEEEEEDLHSFSSRKAHEIQVPPPNYLEDEVSIFDLEME